MDLLISGWTEKEYMKDRKVMHRELIYLQTVRIAISLIFMIRIAGLIIRLMMDGGRMIHFLN